MATADQIATMDNGSLAIWITISLSFDRSRVYALLFSLTFNLYYPPPTATFTRLAAGRFCSASRTGLGHIFRMITVHSYTTTSHTSLDSKSSGFDAHKRSW